MAANPKKDCPHVEKLTLLDLEKFQEIIFKDLKCQKCDEINELWICLICGEVYCSKFIKGHFAEHNKEKPDHCLGLSAMGLTVWCTECITDTQNDSNTAEKPKEKGSYIVSEKTNEYIKMKILSEFLLGAVKKEKVKSREEMEKEKNRITEEEINKILKIERKKEICSHVKDEEILNNYKESLGGDFEKTLKMIEKFREKKPFIGICLTCGEQLYSEEVLDIHFKDHKHKLYANLIDLTIICWECKSKYLFEL